MSKGKTGYKDKSGQSICYGDFIHVEEYPDRYVGGSLDYEGVVEWDDVTRQPVVTYWDTGISESSPLKMFPIAGRKILRSDNIGNS